MKVWVGFGSEHSANLVIIGKFKTAAEATEANDLLKIFAKLANEAHDDGTLKLDGGNSKFPEPILEAIAEHNFAELSHDDPITLVYEFDSQVAGDRMIITTDELNIGAFMKVMIHGGAKIEVYSAHDHGGQYGRRTGP